MDFSRMGKAQREAIQRRAEYIHSVKPTAVRRDIPCPLCGTYMRLRNSMFGRMYACRVPGCQGKHGARPDGSPTGTPIIVPTSELNEMRSRVWDLREELQDACKQTRRRYSDFRDEFLTRWGKMANHPEKWDLETATQMVQHIEGLIRRARMTCYTLILEDSFLEDHA